MVGLTPLAVTWGQLAKFGTLDKVPLSIRTDLMSLACISLVECLLF